LAFIYKSITIDKN